MLNDIFYFINNEERSRLRLHTSDLEEKTITILKEVNKSALSFDEQIVFYDSNNNQRRVLKKEQGLFDRLVLDRPYEVDIARI